MTIPPLKRLELDDRASAFVQEELALAAREFEGPLAARLLRLHLGTPFTFARVDQVDLLRDLRAGIGAHDDSDRFLAAAISRWLARNLDGSERVLVLEDALARRTDAVTRKNVLFQEDRVYFTSSQGDSPDTVARVMRFLSGYPGIGVLSQIPDELGIAELSLDDLDLLASNALAVLVRAWDDEGFAVVPVEGKLLQGWFEGEHALRN